MVALIEQHLDALRALCARHGVARLDLFGSASDPGTFDPCRSDVDFIVAFRRGFDLGPWVAHYFDLRDELEAVLQRPVELVIEAAMQNLLFRQEANRTRQPVYATPDSEAS